MGNNEIDGKDIVDIDDDVFEMNEFEADGFKLLACHENIETYKKGDCFFIYSLYLREMSDALEDYILPKVIGWVRVKVNGKWGYLDKGMKFTANRREAIVWTRMVKSRQGYAIRLTRDCLDMFSDLEFEIAVKYQGYADDDYESLSNFAAILDVANENVEFYDEV